MRVILLTVLALLCLGASSCSTAKLMPDSAIAAMDGGDATVIIEGCGSQPVVGYTYCRVGEGDTSLQSVRLHVPPAQCGQAPCVTWKVFFPNGEPTLGGSVPQGQTSVEISWRDLVKKERFSIGDRGFWPILLEVHWVDRDGRERTSFAEGELRLRVMRQGYLPLHEVREDRAYSWQWASAGFVFKSTTGMRAFAGTVR